MEFVKTAINYLKGRLLGGEITSLIGYAVIFLYLIGLIGGEQYAMLYSLVESMGWGMPGIGALLLATPEKPIKEKLKQ